MSWTERAACRGMSSALFYPQVGESAQPAKKVCSACPVQVECFQAGRADPFGVWGGTAPKDRDRRVNNTLRQRVHGTITGYRQHDALDERPCRDCLDAFHVHEGRKWRETS